MGRFIEYEPRTSLTKLIIEKARLSSTEFSRRNCAFRGFDFLSFNMPSEITQVIVASCPYTKLFTVPGVFVIVVIQRKPVIHSGIQDEVQLAFNRLGPCYR
jgi:hypothetical protein